jgi:hypothetical protein
MVPTPSEEMTMARFLLLLHDRLGEFDTLPEAQMMQIIKAYGDWANKLRAKGKMAGGEKLTDEAGKILQLRNGKVLVTDGPFAEAKELLGGYFMIQADSYEEALQLVSDCPHVTRGARMELRQVQEL